MEKYNVKFKKKFGQNFLKDVRIVKRIVDVVGLDKNSLVIEVGPGGGIMTKELSQVAGQVLAYEIDEELSLELSTRLENYNNIDILFKDFLDADLLNDVSNYSFNKIYFVSNVPYYITTPILFKLIHSHLSFDKIVLMVQKEVGERFSTNPGCREYGAITVLLNYYFDIKKEFFVSRNQFVPVPNVDSVVVSFTEKKNKLEVKHYDFFEALVKNAFQFKRKTIKNNLRDYDLDKISKILDKYGYDLTVRAEMLGVEVFVDMANELL